MLFSEPKIPQSLYSTAAGARNVLSVLFSEPKIPQYPQPFAAEIAFRTFSALQRAENSSIEEV